MESRITKNFIDALFVERDKEQEQYRGAFDKGVDSYFTAASSINYTLDEALAVEINETMPEFQHGQMFDGLRLKSYFRGINASIDISDLYELDGNQRDTVHYDYLDIVNKPKQESE